MLSLFLGFHGWLQYLLSFPVHTISEIQFNIPWLKIHSKAELFQNDKRNSVTQFELEDLEDICLLQKPLS